jgi:mannose/cellobiose epimerase-like protein (N-acyl-D-glucosamine 2-epimerase family)
MALHWNYACETESPSSYKKSNLFMTDLSLEKPIVAVRHQPPRRELSHAYETLEQILTKNITSFWYPQAVDVEEGGYRIPNDPHSRDKSQVSKRLVGQARIVWFFSRLAQSKYGRTEHLKAAKHGYDFLYSRMWDAHYGGFYWEVDAACSMVTKPDKHLYGQAFALYALTEYARASGDSSATAAARDLFNLFETHAHDGRYGGYREFFQRDWKVPEYDSYLGTPPTIKLMNTHLHLMEAITQYYLLTHDCRAKERLVELIVVNSNSVLRKNIGACTDKYLHSWDPLRGPSYDRISYGHDVENVWLLVEACKAAEIPNNLLFDLYRTIFSYALRYGYDRKAGGFYDSGSFHARADQREKILWVQAEGLVAALHMFGLTGEEVYWNCFLQTLDWITKYQANWEHGDWYERIGSDRKPTARQEHIWKSPYHNGRAMVYCLDLLTEMSSIRHPGAIISLF